MTARKPHVRVPQASYIRVLEGLGGAATLDDIAERLDVHPTTARRNLDSLVAQDLVAVVAAPAGRGNRTPRVYRLLAEWTLG